ncbi:MAG: HNH endonuclease [Rhodocyclaceae bacterium]
MFVPIAPSHRQHISWTEVTHVRIRPGAKADTNVGRSALEHIRKQQDTNGLTPLAGLEDGFPVTRDHGNALSGMRAELRHFANSRNAGKSSENKGLVELGRLVADSEELRYPDEIADGGLVTEGACTRVSVNRYERDRSARERAIERWGTKCVCCNVDFERKYGARGAGFIHVHHVVPIASIGQSYQLSPEEDLRPVCPNCHAIIHRFEPMLSIEDVRSILADASNRD